MFLTNLGLGIFNFGGSGPAQGGFGLAESPHKQKEQRKKSNFTLVVVNVRNPKSPMLGMKTPRFEKFQNLLISQMFFSVPHFCTCAVLQIHHFKTPFLLLMPAGFPGNLNLNALIKLN